MMTKRGVVRKCCDDCARRHDCVYMKRGNNVGEGTARCPIIIEVFKARASTGGMGSLRHHFRTASRLYGYLVKTRPPPFPPQI